MRQSLWVDWAVQHPVSTVNHLTLGAGSARDRYYVADLRFMNASEQDALLERFSASVLGPFLAIDRSLARGSLSAFSIEHVTPSGLAAYWVSSSHALRRVVANPFLTWEWRDRFQLEPNAPPEVAPRTHEELRIAHNIALARADAPAAAHWLEALLADCDLSHAQSFADGDALLGSRLERGASLVYTVYFRAAGPDPNEPTLILHSVVSEAAAGSLVEKDHTVADVSMPFTIPASRWKPGYVYASISELIRRIGTERWYGTFRAPRQRASTEEELLKIE
jgi:hypothetical protein